MKHDISKPQGVRGRNSDNSLLREVLECEPSITPEKGLNTTYEWIENELAKADRIQRELAAKL